MYSVNSSLSSDSGTPFIDLKRKANDLRSTFPSPEDGLIEHFSKILKISQVDDGAPANWLTTKRKDTDSPDEESHLSKRVKSVIEEHQNEIPFKLTRREKFGQIENERKRLKPAVEEHADESEVFQIDPEAPSWDVVEELHLVLPALAMLERLDEESLDRIIACLSKRDSNKYPIISHERVFEKLIEVLCSYADVSKEKIIAIFSISNRHRTCLLFDGSLYSLAYPYLERLIARDPDLLFDLLKIKDKWGGYSFMCLGSPSGGKELFRELALHHPKRWLELIRTPLADGRISINNHQTLCEFLNVVKGLSKLQPDLVLEFFSTINEQGGVFFKKPLYVESIVACLEEMESESHALVESVMTRKNNLKSMLAYPEFATQAKSLLKKYPHLLPRASHDGNALAAGHRGRNPFASKTDILNRLTN